MARREFVVPEKGIGNLIFTRKQRLLGRFWELTNANGLAAGREAWEL